MKIFILRHEKRDINNPNFYSPLLEEGLKSSQLLIDELHRLDIDVIYASPFKRVLQTIKPYCDKYNKKVKRDFSLYEKISSNSGFQFPYLLDIIPMDEEYYLLNTSHVSVTNLDEIQIDEDISYRINRFKSYLKNKYLKTDKNILIVTHMSIVNAFQNKDLETYYPMGHLSEITNII
jgi:broad specificity phosphatase PhoE